MATILLVPGAWIALTFYRRSLRALTNASYDTRYAAYPSLDPEDPSATDCLVDTEAIADTLRLITENEGKDVLLLQHSYAGIPGAAAAVGLGKSQRLQEGKAGGIIGFVFIGAFMVPEGLSCAGLQGGNLPPWILLDQVGSMLILVSTSGDPRPRDKTLTMGAAAIGQFKCP